MRRTISVTLLAVSFCPLLQAWGRRGHALATRVAAAGLPKDVPAFLREAAERLAYQASEPDRWRSDRTAALTAISQPHHHFNMELWGAEPFPPTTRHLWFRAVQRGLATEDRGISRLGSGPVGIAELAEQMVTNFLHWRESTAATEPERQTRRQIEESLIYAAGIIAHYVTDLAQPLHTTVHSNGWDPAFPNPRGFDVRPANSLHGRFESVYVQAAMSEEEVAGRLPPPRRLGPWMQEIERHVRRAHSFVVPLYELDKRGAFGSGGEPPEARPFTAARLAEGASMLRDIWYTAWLISGELWLNEPVSYVGRNGRTVLEQMQELHAIEPRHRFETQRTGGILAIVAFDSRRNGMDGRRWRGYLNGKPINGSIDRVTTRLNDRIEYRFERAAP